MNSINTKEIKKLLISHTAFSFSRQIFGIFMSLYIWKLTSSIANIAIYNIVLLLTHTIFFSYFAKFVKNNKANLIKRIGLIGLIVIYLFVFYLGDSSINYLIPIALLIGFFNSMYWISYHTQNFDITHTKNRGHYAGTEKAVKIISTILAPLVGGLLISFNVLGLGYGNIFILGAIVQIFALIYGNVSITSKNNIPYHPFLTLKKLWSHNEQRKLLYTQTLSNFGYSRSTERILMIFLFIILGTELYVGGLLTFFACFSIISTYFIGRHINYNHLKITALLGAVLLSSSIASLVIIPGLITYMIFGSLKQIIEPLTGLGRRIFGLNLLHQDNEQEKHRVEYMVIREWFGIGIGATLSFLPLLFIKEFTIINLAPVLFLMALATLLEGILIKSIKTDITNI